MKDTQGNIMGKTENNNVCYLCGLPYLSEQQIKIHHVYTYKLGECSICGREEPVTHKRNFNYLRYNKNVNRFNIKK